MKAIVHEQGVLEWVDVAVPECAAGEVLIRVVAAGVSRPDVLQRAGLYAPPADASLILGLEVAGYIVAGELDGGFVLGDAVCALVHGGGYAEYVAVPLAHCLPVPRGWSMVEAAGLPESLFTVWFNVFEKAELGRAKSEVLLVQAGASGIGLAAIQMARALGQTVYAVASSPDKRQACLDFGAHAAFAPDAWVDEVWALGGVDVVLDVLAGASAESHVRVLKHGGRLVWIAYLSGRQAILNVQEVMAKELVVTGSFLRRQNRVQKAQIADDLRRMVWPHLASGRIRPMVDSVFSVQEAELAHERLRQRQNIGKVILQMPSSTAHG
ncbi:MAG: NAD(P)H-quinone oxidoreductase [Formosimonas sp.]